MRCFTSPYRQIDNAIYIDIKQLNCTTYYYYYYYCMSPSLYNYKAITDKYIIKGAKYARCKSTEILYSRKIIIHYAD